MAYSDSRWNEVLQGRVELNPDGEVGHFVKVQNPIDPDHEIWDVVYLGGRRDGSPGFDHAAGYAD